MSITPNPRAVLLSLGLLAAAVASRAQTAQSAPAPEPRNIVQLSATCTVEAQQEWLTLVLSTAKDGSDAAAVQASLRQALETALGEAKRSA